MSDNVNNTNEEQKIDIDTINSIFNAVMPSISKYKEYFEALLKIRQIAENDGVKSSQRQIL